MSNEMIPAAQVVPYGDMERMAAVIAQSGLFGVKAPVQALALMLIAQADGLHPATAARDYHVIQGRPALKTDAMLARFQAAGGRVAWHDYTDSAVSATFSHPSGGSVRIEWTLDRARTAGLAGKDTWKQYPRAMLRARVISEGIRTVYPGVLSGMYAPEEVRDMPPLPLDEPPPAPVAAPPAPVHAPVPGVAQFDADAADSAIAAFSDVTEMRAWLAAERQRHGWRPGDAPYEAMKAACAERAQAIKAAAKRPPLNPAPGKAATAESLAAAGFAAGNGTPFDDALSGIAGPAEESAE